MMINKCMPCGFLCTSSRQGLLSPPYNSPRLTSPHSAGLWDLDLGWVIVPSLEIELALGKGLVFEVGSVVVEERGWSSAIG